MKERTTKSRGIRLSEQNDAYLQNIARFYGCSANCVVNMMIEAEHFRIVETENAPAQIPKQKTLFPIFNMLQSVKSLFARPKTA